MFLAPGSGWVVPVSNLALYFQVPGPAGYLYIDANGDFRLPPAGTRQQHESLNTAGQTDVLAEYDSKSIRLRLHVLRPSDRCHMDRCAP